MSTYTADKTLESLKELILPIEKELIEITNMASDISEKFQGISKNIESLSGLIGVLAGRKSGALTSLAGGIFSVIGDIRADEERQRALRKLLPKKQELAKLKTSIITSFRDSMNNKIEPLSLLLVEEVNRSYDETQLTEYENLYGNSCLNAFDLYVSTYYLIQICDFMLSEFSAWNEFKHESEYESPDKSFVLDIVLNEIIFPNGLRNGISSNNSNAGIWLLSKRESILAGSMYEKYKKGKKIEDNKGKGFYSESYKKTRVIKRESYIALKTYISEIKKTVTEDKTGKLKVITESSIYKQAKSVCNIGSIFNYSFIRYFILFLCFTLESAYRNNSSYLSAIYYGLALAFAFSLVCKFWMWSKNVKSESGGCLESIFSLGITIFSLGTIPLLVKSYENKEISFENFIAYLRNDAIK